MGETRSCMRQGVCVCKRETVRDDLCDTSLITYAGRQTEDLAHGITLIHGTYCIEIIVIQNAIFIGVSSFEEINY